MKKSTSKSTTATKAVGKASKVAHTKRASRPGKVERDTPIPYVPSAAWVDPKSPRGQVADLVQQGAAKDREIVALRAQLAMCAPTSDLLRADGSQMREPNDGTVPGGFTEWRPLAEMAAERAVFATRRTGSDHVASLGTLVLEKLSNGHHGGGGKGVAAGALKTVLGSLELVRAVVRHVPDDEYDPASLEDMLTGLHDLGTLAIEVEDRAMRADADARAEATRQSKAVAS